jgi:dihydrodipicolinate synthase/N-acetylneuraminate lyase
MKPLGRGEIKGTWATLLLPIAEDESIDWRRLEAEIDVLLSSRVDGIYSNGTAGEFYAQTEAEFDRIQQTLAERCEKAGMPFQAGASHPCAQTCLARARRAAQLRPSAIQVILPDWFPVTPVEAAAFLEKVAEASAPVPLVVYNPPHAKRVLSPQEWQMLAAAVPALVGVKVGGGDDAWYAAMKATGLSVFVPGHELASGYARGAAGSYSNVACLHPWGAKRWNMQMETDLAGALEFETRIRNFIDRYVRPFRTQGGVSNQALDKLLAWIGNWADIGLRLRWPYRWIEESSARGLRERARAEIPELFSAA